MSAPWSTRVKKRIAFVLVFTVLWLAVGAVSSAVASYLGVIYGRTPRWHGTAYLSGLGTGLVVFVVSLLYTFDTVAFVDDANYTAVTLALAAAAAAVGTVAGGVNWLAAHLFFEKIIYGRIVVKD